MLTEYIEAAMRHAKYEILPDDNSYYGEIAECRGVYANEMSLSETKKDLRGALEGWILLGIRHGAELLVIDGIDINVHELV
ncbi:MAG TPA: type II toxin-antitoxin system HicB family antitoxin [Candidatus Kapabacteria bacterium]